MIMRAIWTRLALGIATLALALASGAANAVDDCDFLTGGGFIIVNGDKANFGVGGGCKDGMHTWGHLEYIDHGADVKVHGTSITGYFRDGSDGPPDSQGHPTGTRIICGTARTNLPPYDVNFIVRARDAGEPGTSTMDQFDITLTTIPTYSTLSSGIHQLSGGNIQLHNPNPSTTGTFGGACAAG